MEALSNLQFNLESTISKARSNFKKSPKERLTSSYIETRLENLEANWSAFFETHRKIVSSVKSIDYEKSEYNIKNTYETTEELFTEYKTELKEALKKIVCSDSSAKVLESSAKGSKQICSVKLPKIELPMFTGSYSEWISFRDLFKSLIHDNSALDDVQKLHYLKSHLSGEAEGLLRHIPITSSNYATCWSKLENRYNNKKYLANCIIKRFMSQKNIVTESSSAIKELLDTSNECLHALGNLDIMVEHWDVIVIYVLSLKLDTESRKQWEMKISDCSDELPTMNQFKSFLEQRFRSLEFLDNKGQGRQFNRNVPVKSLHVSTILCIFCQDNHKLANCKKFAGLDIDKRRNFVQTNGLCYNCLGANHSVYACRQSTRCHICKKKHHSLLHLKNVSKSGGDSNKPDQVAESSVSAVATSNQSNSTNIVSCFANSHSQILLATALIAAESKSGTAIVLRSLLDQGSQASFVTESAVQLLGLKRIPTKDSISGIGCDQDQSTISLNSMVLIKVKSRVDPSFIITVKAYVLKKLTTILPERKVMANVLTTISSLTLADPSFDTPNKIDLLLGAEVYGQILLEGLIRGSPGQLIAQNTRLGWILSGQVGEINQSETCHNTVVTLHSTLTDENTLLKQFWELEAEPKGVNDKVYLTPEEQRCEEIFKGTTKRDESGRYIVHMPFRSSDPACKYGGSKDIALKRFLTLEKRFLRNPEFKAQYSAVINEYIALNHMDIVQDKDKEGCVYLPHHAVIRNEKSTTKVRIVFDASCVGSNGVSLNHDLMVGPPLQSELRHIIMRWRCEPICLVADIVKMYRQIRVCNDHTDFQRILWRENPDDEIQVLRHLRVTFGTSSAPYLAVRSLQQLAQDEGAEFPLAKNRVLSDFYMDDLMTGCQTIEEGVEIYKQISELLKRGGFPLQKWASNNKELLRLIEDGQQIPQTQGNMELKTDAISKILGLTWDKDNDEFVYTIQLNELDLPVTKRKVISDIARLFDPLGWLAPIIITAKVFIQRIWMTGIEWDAELPAPLLKEWLDFRKNLCNLVKFRLPRWINSSKENRVLELHGFSDASNVAYAAVVYVRIIDREGQIHTTLMTSKTKVAPVKQVSIPRLELCGAVLLAKLLQEVASTLEVPKQHLYAWTDSSVVLAWLSSHPSRWKTFIANRVSEILTIMDRSQWSHVLSSENPADCASRGVSSSECSDLQLWKRGPVWLQNEKIDYNRGNIQETTLEERKIKRKCHATAVEFDDSLLTRFSKFSRLIRVIAYCRRFLRMKESERNKIKITTWLTTKELNEAVLTCIKLCQLQSFSDEIESVKRNRKLNKGSRLTSLSPFLDDDGILRVGGRLHRASIDENMKHPILIPHKSHFTNLLIAEAHERTLHGGPQLMLNYLRSKYWIINAKTLVRQHVHKCVICIRHSSQTHQQMMGQLPKARVSVQKPFQCSGVDYAGPISIRSSKGRGHHSTKGYICLFVCMSTRAIHLEVVSDMTSQSFLAAFKRFVARRGRVLDLWSDNGTTFVGSAKELRQLFNAERSVVASEIADFLSMNGTTWHFIPPHAPNFGGLWEAGVKSTKHHLKRIIGTSTLTFEEMTTVLAQIEACLNSRPISQLSNNPEDSCPLTPGHFLVDEPLVTVPDVNYENSSVSNLKRWHLTQKMLQNFWRRWSLEYLTQLQHRYKWTDCKPEPEIGDVVLVKEDGLPPARWLYGIITNKHPGLDNITRVVTIRCKNNEIKRPISKLIILPVNT